MKACLRLALVVFALAGLVMVPASVSGQIGGGDLQCAQFCMVALCAQPQTCGVFINAEGQRDCGCHDSGVILVGP